MNELKVHALTFFFDVWFINNTYLDLHTIEL